MFAEAKAWVLGNLLLILGVVLALTASYAAWLHFITVPNLELRLTGAEANAKIWEANNKTCTTANVGLAGAIERQNAALRELARLGAANKAAVGATLAEIERLMAGVPATLEAYKPDPAKTDCQNAMVQVEAFKRERGQ